VLKYLKTHEWAKIEAGIAVVGISDHAQSQLGDIVFVELPRKGLKVKAGERLATVESTKAAAEVYAPLSGEVIEVNNAVIASPQLLNESPQDKGWIARIKISRLEEAQTLLDEKAYQEFIKAEKH
jgi:glycine cleavage system H protein